MNTVNTKTRIEVNSLEEAWRMVDQIFPTDYIKDEVSSKGAGYPVYRSTAKGHFYDYICDLNDRLEINLSNGKTVNVWFSELYWKFRGIAEKNVELARKVDELEEQVAWLNKLIEIYESDKAQLRESNAELSAKIQKIYSIIA